MPVAVDHLVRVLALGGPHPGPLDHQDLGLDVERGVALAAPGHLEGERDHGRPEQHDGEGDERATWRAIPPRAPAGGGPRSVAGPTGPHATSHHQGGHRVGPTASRPHSR